MTKKIKLLKGPTLNIKACSEFSKTKILPPTKSKKIIKKSNDQENKTFKVARTEHKIIVRNIKN